MIMHSTEIMALTIKIYIFHGLFRKFFGIQDFPGGPFPYAGAGMIKLHCLMMALTPVFSPGWQNLLFFGKLRAAS